jgi:hypothetical protein
MAPTRFQPIFSSNNQRRLRITSTIGRSASPYRPDGTADRTVLFDEPLAELEVLCERRPVRNKTTG